MNILPPSYQTHLKSQLGTSQYLLLVLLIGLLQGIKQVKLETLASALPLPILFESKPVVICSGVKPSFFAAVCGNFTLG